MVGELISIREFARRVGVSDTAVLKAIKAGKISPACLDHSNPKRPKIYPQAALKSWGRNYAPNWSQSGALDAALNASAQPQENTHLVDSPGKNQLADSTPVIEPEAPVNNTEAGPDEDEESDHIHLKKNATLNEAKRVEAIAQAKLAQVKLAEQKGKLVLKEKVYKQFYDVGVRVRTALQGIPDKIIDNLLACDNRSEAHAFLYSAISEALEALAINTEEI